MIVYQTDPDGYLVGPVNADPSPLEPGEWLIPGGCVTTAPPSLTENERARWTGDVWVIELVPEPEPEPEPPPPTLEERRARMTASAFQTRAALHLAGHLAAAEAFVEASGDPVIQMAWEYAVEFKRMSPTILAAQAALELSDEQIDELFALAATIEA